MNSSCTSTTTPALVLPASSPSSQCLTSTLTLEGHQPLQSLTWGIGKAMWKEGCLSSSTHLDQCQLGRQIPATPTYSTRNSSIPREDWRELSAEQSLAPAFVLPGEILQATSDSAFCKPPYFEILILIGPLRLNLNL